ncbi:2190_t:CDS:2, partial [Funneliformis caledonium]
MIPLFDPLIYDLLTSSSSSTPNAAPSSHHQQHSSRRKKHSNKINRKKVDDAITWSAFAVEEDNQGNHDVAMEFYLKAIEDMLEAVPIHANQSRKDALKNKLRDFMDRSGLTDDFMESTNAFSAAKTAECEESQSRSGANISQHFIQAAITSAVALKQSPIPDAITATMNYTMKKIQKIDETYGLQDKAWEISRSGMNLALGVDDELEDCAATELAFPTLLFATTNFCGAEATMEDETEFCCLGTRRWKRLLLLVEKVAENIRQTKGSPKKKEEIVLEALM